MTDRLEINRREFLKSALIVAGSVVTGGVGGCTRRQTNGARVTLTQWYHQYGETGTQDAVMRYAAQYTKAHPDIAVNVVWVPGDYGTKLNTALLTAGGPDVFEKQLSVPMVSAGQVAPLDDILADVKNDFDPNDLLSNSVDSKIYAIKMVTDTGAIFYRKSLFAKAGIKPPQTLDELAAAATALTEDDRKGLYMGNDGGIGATIYLFPWSAGEDFLKNDKITFNTPRTAKAYEKMRDFMASKAILPSAPTDWWDPSAFTQSLAAMQWGGLWAFPAMKKEFGDDLGAVAWPALDGQGKPATFFGGWSQMVNSRSENLDEAKKYVRWLWIENKKLQSDWNLSYGFHVPPRASVAREAKPLQDPTAAAIVKDLYAYGHVLPPAWSNSMGTALSDAVVNIVKLGLPAADQLSTAQHKCERELERMMRFRE